MENIGSSSIKKITRTGKRKTEFDSLFYMRDVLRRQYILDRYLKRLPKGDVKLNDAMSARFEFGTDANDNEDLQEAYQRGWIDFQDILKYYKLTSKGEFPPNLLKRQDIILGNLLKKTNVKTKILTGKKVTIKPKKIYKDAEYFKDFFDKLEKKEGVKGKSIAKIIEKGFSDMTISRQKKNKMKEIKKSNYKVLNEILKITGDYLPKDFEKIHSKKDKNDLVKEKNIPIWKKSQNAENYNNEEYSIQNKKMNEYYSKGRASLGLTKDEKKIQEIDKKMKLLGLKDLIKETKSKDKKRRPTIFEDINISLKKRKGSVGSSRKSSVGSSRKSSVGSSRKSSVGSSNKSLIGYGSPASSDKDLWSDTF